MHHVIPIVYYLIPNKTTFNLKLWVLSKNKIKYQFTYKKTISHRFG